MNSLEILGPHFLTPTEEKCNSNLDFQFTAL